MEISNDVDHVLRVIRSAGGHPVLVGGCVRDHLMGVKSKDVDIEVYGLNTDALAHVLMRLGVVDEVGKSFGVFKLRVGDTDLDISLPRRESKSGAGHRGFDVVPDNELTMEVASARRDFTINSIMFDPQTKAFIDYHGGMRDIDSGILRHTSDAFGDDPLRVLRGVQFAARFGFTMAAETVAVCFDLKPEFSDLSLERIWGEWEKIGRRGIHIDKALDVLFETDWVSHFPELFLTVEGAADMAADCADVIGFTGEDRLVIIFAKMLSSMGEDLVTGFLTRIGCPPGIVKRILPLVREADAFDDEPTPVNVRRLARRLVPANIAELYAMSPNFDWYARAVRLDVAMKPDPAVLSGDHLIALGMKPGPVFKVILADALAAQDSGVFSTVEAAIEWVKGRV